MKRIKDFAIGFLVATLVFASVPVFAETVQVAFNKVNIFVRGQQVAKVGESYTLSTGAKIPNSISYLGTTYLPLRRVGELVDKNILWDNKTQTVSINDKSGNTNTNPPTIGEGSLSKPLPADNASHITFQPYSFKNKKVVQLSLEEVITGEAANAIVDSENMFNEKPTENQEWRLFTFNLKYISGVGEEILEASDIITESNFFTPKGSNLSIYSSATLGDKYGPYHPYKVELYPQGESKVVIGLLVDKTQASPIIRVLNDSGETTWISLSK